jgi:hypothetical protein
VFHTVMWGPVSIPRIRFAVSWSLFRVEVTRGETPQEEDKRTGERVPKAVGKGARSLSAEVHGNKLLIAGLAASGRGREAIR